MKSFLANSLMLLVIVYAYVLGGTRHVAKVLSEISSDQESPEVALSRIIQQQKPTT